MTRVDITYQGDTIVKSITALVQQPVTPTTAPPIDIGLVEISTPAIQVPGPIGPPGPGVVIHDAPPADPVNGTLWWESDTGILWARYVEPEASGGDSAQWVQISGGVGGPETDLPITPQMFGAAGDGTTDDTAALQAAAAAGMDIYVPAGTYKVTDMVTIQNGRTWQGAGRTRSIIYVPNTFNLSALGVIQLGTSEPGASLFDIGISFQQNTAETVRANLVHYPPAIYAVLAARCQIDRIRITAAWDGIDLSGNTGGAWLGRLEIGAINRGILIDGNLDFIHGESWHFWPFGYSGTASYTSIWIDGSTVAAELGAMQSLSLDKLSAFSAKIVCTAGATTAINNNIGILQLDGDNARLVHNGRCLIIGEIYSSKSSAPSLVLADIEVSGGRLLIGLMHRFGGTVPAIAVTSTGICQVNGGYLGQIGDAICASVTSTGVLIINNAILGLPTATRTNPYLAQTGAGGQLRVKGCTIEASGGSGPVVTIAVDSNGHDISGNNFFAYSIALPANSILGCYGPNRITRASFTPTLTFATPGDLSYSASVATGIYYWEASGYRFFLRLVIPTVTYTTASGEARIAGLPADNKGFDALSVNVARWSKLNIDTGYTDVSAGSVVNTSYLRLIQQGDNVSIGGLTTAHIPTGTTNFELTIDGFIPTQ